MKKLLVILIFFAAASISWGQSVSPMVVECGKRCSGQFTVSNDQTDYMTTTVEPFSFKLSPESKTLFEPLHDAIVTMKETSARIPAQSDWTFDYDIRCDVAPCRVALAVAMVVGKPNPNGITVRMVIPHIAYLCDKAKNCRRAVRAAAGLGE